MSVNNRLPPGAERYERLRRVPMKGLSRRDFLAASASLTVLPTLRGGDRMLIENVDRFRVVEPMFEGVRIVLSHLGEAYTPAYIQGISGGAFRMAGICPCARNRSNQMGTTDLIELLGYKCEPRILGWVDDVDDAKRNMAELIPKIKRSIDDQRPVLLWYGFADSAFEVVTGYDDSDGSFLGRHMWQGPDDPPARAQQTRAQECVKMFPALGAIFVGPKTGELDAKATEVAALREAVRHARDPVVQVSGPPRAGLCCYDRWVADWKKPEKKREGGDTYCLAVYRSTHRAAGLFLNEIAHRYQKAEHHLRSAGDDFIAEADSLDRAMPSLGWDAPEHDPQRNERVWPMLQEARDRYASAIEEIDRALRTMV